MKIKVNILTLLLIALITAIVLVSAVGGFSVGYERGVISDDSLSIAIKKQGNAKTSEGASSSSTSTEDQTGIRWIFGDEFAWLFGVGSNFGNYTQEAKDVGGGGEGITCRYEEIKFNQPAITVSFIVGDSDCSGQAAESPVGKITSADQKSFDIYAPLPITEEEDKYLFIASYDKDSGQNSTSVLIQAQAVLSAQKETESQIKQIITTLVANF